VLFCCYGCPETEEKIEPVPRNSIKKYTAGKSLENILVDITGAEKCAAVLVGIVEAKMKFSSYVLRISFLSNSLGLFYARVYAD
jgi:hypothetical protein